MIDSVSWGSPGWFIGAIGALALAGLAALLFTYAVARIGWSRRACALTLKTIALLALAVLLAEPLFSGIRPRPGANLFVVVADNSRSLQLHDRKGLESRGEVMRKALDAEEDWRVRLGQDFDVRNYLFDSRLQPTDNFAELDFKGESSSLRTTLQTIGQRFRGRSIAGVAVLTDGNATDIGADAKVDWSGLPPIYPVVVGESRSAKDILIRHVTVSQSNFEAAPVSIQAEIMADGYSGQSAVVQLLDEDGDVLEKQEVQALADETPIVVRFKLKPDRPGIRFYQVRVFAKQDGPKFKDPESSAEATLANNSRLALVDRGGGPYRVLYVSGRPNWEFKFLRRSLEEDDEVHVVGLVRIARREPKFNFIGRRGETTNPLFRGFNNQEDEQAEQYDEPVLLRLSTRDQEELRDGFPKAADQLFEYQAIILDDIEAEFFTQDQMLLLQKFVSQRGGGLLMLGGQESFVNGKYARTPLGELLPVYLDRSPPAPTDEVYRLSLTRDGEHPPWSFFRARSTMDEERKRFNSMPPFKTLNRVRGVKPGAAILAEAKSPQGDTYPALVAHRFGNGRSSALLIGDLWRLALKREDDQRDIERVWRQTIRWLVADVPHRIDVRVIEPKNDPLGSKSIRVTVRDEKYQPLDNAAVKVTVRTPDKNEIELTAESSDAAAGQYATTFVPRQSGAYLASIQVTAPDGSDIGERETGWTSEPETREFEQLTPNTKVLEEIAAATEGEVVKLDKLSAFVSSLPNRKIPHTEPWVYSWWEVKFLKLGVFLVLCGCLIGEWAVRRMSGLP